MDVSAVENDSEESFEPMKINNNYKLLLDSDSEEEIHEAKIAKKKTNIESEDESGDESMNISKNKEQSDETGSESENEEANREEPKPKDRRKNSNPKKKIIPEKRQRKSAAKAMDVINEKMTHKKQEELKQKIQSEKQRMEREQQIYVPYHKPKQYTLREFMSRRTINKPSTEKIKQGEKPISAILALKNISANIEAFAQKMKEREEEALIFFKSESESDDEEETCVDKENVVDNVESTKNPASLDQKVEIAKDSEKDAANIEKSVKTFENVTKPTDDHKEKEVANEDRDAILTENDSETVSINALTSSGEIPAIVCKNDDKISEDPELERLRDKYLNMPQANDIQVKKENSKPKLSFSTLKTLDEMGSKDTIDLETGSIQPRKLSGPEMLFQRYLKTVQKPKQKDTVCMNILSIENGKLENTTVEVKLDKEIKLDHNRPGYSHEKMKETLRNQIVDKRLHELKIKAEKAEKEKSLEFEPDQKPEAQAIDEDSETSDLDEQESEDEGNEENYNAKRKKKPKTAGSSFFDDQAIDEDGSEDGEESESGDSSSSEEEEEEITTEDAPKKSRILKAFVDSDDEDSKSVKAKIAIPAVGMIVNSMLTEEIVEPPQSEFCSLNFNQSDEKKPSEDLFNTQNYFTFTEPSVSEEMKTRGIESLFDSVPSQFADDDLLEICSGRFAETQESLPQITPDTQALLSQALDTQEDNFSESQLVSNLTGNKKIVEEKAESQEKHHRKVLESTDDEVDAVDNAVKEKRKKKKKKKQKVKKLGFSDDEDEADLIEQNEEVAEGEEDLEECEEEQEIEDVLVDYDSEENEIEVKMNKKDKVKFAGVYFDDEAELSESEWGSADEDEKDMDKFDIELGDEDQYDQNKLREEVGRIHARRMLDDDIKNVKKIEDLLFEDEEVNERERKFRWKNQDNNLTLVDENARDGDLPQDDEEFDEDSEILWRKMRHERETMLSEQALKMTDTDTMSDEIVLLDQDSQTVTTSSTSMMAKRKFTIVKSSSSLGISPTVGDITKKDSPFLIKTSNLKKFRNSSFLSRDNDTLSKIARFVSHKDDEVTNFSHGSNSMSFMTIDRPDESKKRKSDGNSVPEPSKKRKVEPQKKQLLLNQLM